MRKIFFLSIGLSILTIFTFVNFEPELLTAATSATATSTVTFTVESELTMSGPANINMGTNITISQHTSIGTSTITVVTNDTDGYTLNLHAASTTAMQSSTNPISDYFDDYTPVTAETPEAWTENADAYEFGFAVFGDDVSNVTDIVSGGSATTWGNPTATDCGTAGAAAISAPNLNWMNFASTTDRMIASRTATTTQAGVVTTICVAAEQGSNVFVPSGAYTAAIVATASVQ